MLKRINQLPVVHVPGNYPYVMPSCMAQAAMEHGPIFRIDWPPLRQAVCLVGPEANTLFYHTHERCFSHAIGWGPVNQALLGKGLFSLEEPEHMYYRKIINPTMTAHYVASYFNLLCEIIQQFIDAWEDQQVIDLRVEIQKITFTVATRLLCHIEDAAEIPHLYNAFHRMIAPGRDPATESREQLLERFDGYNEINKVLNLEIDQRRRGIKKNVDDDLISILDKSINIKGQPLSKKDILAHVRTMVSASYETSIVLICSLLYLLSTHPAYLERVCPEFDLLPVGLDSSLVLERLKEMRLLGYALQEAGRLYGPQGNMRRGVIRAFEFGGYLVPEGALAVLSISGGHRLPTVFSHPESFDPDRLAPPREEDKRLPHALINFGSGPRICSGVHFAQIEVKAIAALILRKWQLEPVDQRGITIAYFNPDGFLAHSLNMRVKRRKSRASFLGNAD